MNPKFFQINLLDIFPIIIVLVSIGIIAVFFNFNADDAFIYMRYSVNLIESGALVYNLGEQINTLTSPLMAFVDALLYMLFTNIALSLKVLSLLLLFLSVAFILKRFKYKRHSQLIILSVVILSPCVLLWTVGGLDTIIILFFSTVSALFTYKEKEISDRALFAVCFFAGLLFFARYSSILFSAPLVLHAFIKSGNIKKSAAAAFIGSIIPFSWIIASYLYYGDIFPTSLYVKSPGYDLQKIVANAWYIFQYLFFINATSFILLFFFSVKSPRKIFHILRVQFFQYWGLYVGILFLFIYGLSVAGTTHMMFSFRYFVPYIPALSILIADLFAQYGENIEDKQFVSVLILVISFQIFQAAYTYQKSVNGIVLNGELRHFSIKENNHCLKIFEEMAFAINEHWNQIPISNKRYPRIYTVGEGILPFTYREAYIYGMLVSYRHQCNKTIDCIKSSDYFITHISKNADKFILLFMQEFTKKVNTEISIVKRVDCTFDGVKGWIILLFNPDPCDHFLSNRINEPCKEVNYD